MTLEWRRENGTWVAEGRKGWYVIHRRAAGYTLWAHKDSMTGTQIGVFGRYDFDTAQAAAAEYDAKRGRK